MLPLQIILHGTCFGQAFSEDSFCHPGLLSLPVWCCSGLGNHRRFSIRWLRRLARHCRRPSTTAREWGFRVEHAYRGMILLGALRPQHSQKHPNSMCCWRRRRCLWCCCLVTRSVVAAATAVAEPFLPWVFVLMRVLITCRTAALLWRCLSAFFMISPPLFCIETSFRSFELHGMYLRLCQYERA